MNYFFVVSIRIFRTTLFYYTLHIFYLTHQQYIITRKDIRERLGLSIKQMSEIVGLPVTTLASIESRKSKSSKQVDEVYLLYLKFVEQTSRGVFDNHENTKQLIFNMKRKDIEDRVKKLNRSIALYRRQLVAAEETYKTAISTYTSYEFLREVAAEGSINLQDRITIAALTHLKKTLNNHHNKVLKMRTRLEWSLLEVDLLLGALNEGSIV